MPRLAALKINSVIKNEHEYFGRSYSRRIPCKIHAKRSAPPDSPEGLADEAGDAVRRYLARKGSLKNLSTPAFLTTS
jgi:hypothetical protein